MTDRRSWRPADDPGRASGDAGAAGPLFERPPLTHAGGNRAEKRAARRMAPAAPSLRMRVLAWIRERPQDGRTKKECGRIYARERGRHEDDGSSWYSVAPRMTELYRAGFITDSLKDREGSIVWVANSKDGDGRVCEPDPSIPSRPRSAAGAED